MTIKINLRFPLDFGRADKSNRIRLELELPDDETEVQPLREIPGASSMELSGREQYVSFDGTAKVHLSISDGLTGRGFRRDLRMRFQVGIGQPITAFSNLPPTTPLLQGQILLDLDDLRPSLFTEFNDLLKRCWLTRNLDEIDKLRFEPSGFYLAGAMPTGLLQGPRRTWVLRVPQPKLAKSNSQVIALPQRTRNDSVWELTSEKFILDDTTVNAVQFVQEINATFRDFESDGRRLLDSVNDPPQSTVSIKFRRVSNQLIRWHASAAETRLVIGGLQGGETQFEPNFLIGEIHATDGRTWHHHHTSYVDAEDLQSAFAPETNLLVSLAVNRPSEPPVAEDIQLDFPEVSMLGLNMPTVTTDAALETTDAGVGADEFLQRETVERAWMCLEQGWLGLDADLATLKLKENAASAGRMGVLAIDALMKSLRPDIEGQGFSLRLLPQSGNHAAIKLSGLQREKMTLEVDEPLSILTTPPMWYLDLPRQRETPDDPDAPVPARPRGWVPSMAMRLEQSGAMVENPEEDPAQAISGDRESFRGEVAETEQTIRQILRQADWISKKAVDLEESAIGFDPQTTPLPFQALIQWDDGFGLSIPVDQSRVVFWNRPTSVPIVRTYPQNTSQVPTALLEDQRGMIPYVLKHAASSLVIEIPQQQLPRLRRTPFEFAVTVSPDWRPDLGSDVLLMLPTLPGAEATVDGDDVRWQLRHAVPVLDESYRETRESDDAFASQSFDGSIDITRVEQATALEINVGEMQIANWLHLSSEAANQVDVLAFTPRGSQPTLQIELSNSKTVTFSRTANVSGLTQGISVTSTDRGGSLPSFAVAFSEDNSDWEIRRNGQPLINASSAQHGITTLDGRGTVRGEATGTKIRFRPEGAGTDQFKRTANYRSAHHAFSVVGLEEQSFQDCHDPHAQQWSFHDGVGDWPQWMGFGLYPLQQSFASDESASVTCQLLPIAQLSELTTRVDQPASRDSHAAQARLVRPATSVVELKLSLEDGSPGSMEITDVTGRFQWRFDELPEPIEGVDQSVSVQGITASIAESLDDHAIVDIHELILRTPLGTVRLSKTGFRGKLESGSLTIASSVFDPNSAGDQIGATIRIGEITIRSADTTQALVSAYSFSWTQDRSNTASWTLTRSSGGSPWKFSLSLAGKTESFEYSLSESRLARRSFVFGAEALQLDKQQGLFSVERSDGILGVEFSTSTHLRFLVGELLFGLKSRLNESDRLAARLKLTKQSIDGEVEVTGAFSLNNAIEFQSTEGPITHAIKFFLDRAELPIVPLLLGVASGETSEAAVLAEHTLEFPDGRQYQWQAPQWICLRSLENFHETYFSTPPDASLPLDTLVIDSGTVVWLQQPEQDSPASPRSLPDLFNPEYSIAIALRPIEPTRVDKTGFFVRLPFAATAETETLHSIAMDLTARGLVLDSRGAQREIFRLPTRRSMPEMSFFQRGDTANLIDASQLASGLKPLQGDRALPAFENADGKPTDYPSELSDFAPISRIMSETQPHNLLATTVVRRHPVATESDSDQLFAWWKDNGQVLFGSTLLELGYRASSLDASSLGSTANVQLLVVQEDGITPIANQVLEETSDAAILSWAHQILDQKSRRLNAVVLRNYSEFVVVPPAFQNLRDEVPDVWSFDIEEEVVPIDPRLVIPHHISIDREVGGDPAKMTEFAVEPDVSLFAFEAKIPQTEITAPERSVVAATHFGIATIHDGAPAKRVRPALASRVDQTQALTWSQMDEVSFQANTSTYPAINSLALSNLPLPTFDLQSNTSTILPPLMHCVSWASRPGEMASTTWTCESFDVAEDSIRLKRSKPSVVSLRRPRAQAGKFEKVRLLNPTGGALANSGGYVLQRRFVYSELDLEQTLGRTAVPEQDGINGVLVTDETFSPSHKKLDDAKPEPALIYDRGSTPKFKFNLQLFAGFNFDPNSIPGASGDDVIDTQSFLVLAVENRQMPPNYAKDDQPELPDGMVSLFRDGTIVAPIPRPKQSDDTAAEPWRKLPDSDTVFSLQLDDVDQTLSVLINKLGAMETLPSFKIEIVRYQLNPDDELFHKREVTEMAMSIQVLQKNAAITAPKTSVTLLEKTSNVDAYVIGYGRLSPGDFSLPSPQFGAEDVPEDDSKREFIEWLRFSRLRSLDRSLPGDDPTVPSRDYDVVVYGPGGELLPTRP